MFTEDESLRRTRLTHFLKSYLPHAFSFSCIGHTFLNILPYVVFNPRKPTLNHYFTKIACWKFQVCIMTKHSMLWCNIAWRHPTVGLRSVNFQVKSALCRVTVSTPPSLLRRVLCISHSTISLSLSVELMWHLAQWHSDIFCWYFFSVAPQEKHRVLVCILRLLLLCWPGSNSAQDGWSLLKMTYFMGVQPYVVSRGI